MITAVPVNVGQFGLSPDWLSAIDVQPVRAGRLDESEQRGEEPDRVSSALLLRGKRSSAVWAAGLGPAAARRAARASAASRLERSS